MRSLASAARLLARIIDPATSQPLLDELGFGRLVPLEREDRASLALPETVGNPHIARGIGTLRVLVFEAGPSQHFRKELNRVAGGLASSGPGLLWTLIAIDREAGQTAVAAFDLSSNRPRVAALIATSQNIVDSDSETVCALAAARNSSDALTHCRWLEILGRESVNRKFFRALEHQVSQLAASLLPSARKEDAFELALLHSSRLLFLSFLETKGWLDGDRGFLANQYADCMVSGGRFHARVLEPLFFGTLNTRRRDRARRAAAFGRIPFLNGGLFSRSPLEGRLAKTFFSDESLGDLFGELLSRYRFTAREDTTLWSEAAIDPEMLGKSFECLMSSDTRKNTGAFYTPQSLVARVAETTLAYALESSTIPYDDVSCALQGEMPPPRQRRNILERLRTMTVLDPACGSGAFLIHVLEQLSTLCVRLGDPRPLHVIRREILTQTIFGVDVNPTAVWLCELRLWLSMAIEDPEKDPFRVTPLPNLDRNIRVGDSLSGEGFKGTASVLPSRRIAAARGRYCRATGPRKRSLARHLDSIERECAIAVAALRVRRLREKRRDTLDQLRSRDLFGQRHYPAAKSSGQLARVRDEMRRAESELRHLKNGGAMPFSFAAQFADVAGRGGFTVVVGNPPWIRTHNLAPRSRVDLKRTYASYRNSAWAGGTEPAGAGRGFGSQVDVAALFIERSIDLLRPDGMCGLIVPSKLWRSLAGGGVRDFLTTHASIRELHDLSEAPLMFDAAVYPSILVAGHSTKGTGMRVRSTSLVVHRDDRASRWCAEATNLRLNNSAGSPWLLLPSEARGAFDRVVDAGTPFFRTTFGRPLLGVKTGCNDAFIVKNGQANIESDLLRPLLRGDRVSQWKVNPGDARIIWTHDDHGQPLSALPPLAATFLRKRRLDLARRSDAAGHHTWWMLFRTESANSSLPRVVWSDIGRRPRAAVLKAGDRTVALNSCYVARCPTLLDAYALAALLNSVLAAAWLSVIAEPARGNYRRYLGWTMSILPLPRAWTRARSILAPIGVSAAGGEEPSPEELLEATLDAYELRRAEVAPLLAWAE